MDGLTAVGAIIKDPQGPDEIVDGVEDLIQDIKDNPKKYGIQTGLDYSTIASSMSYAGISVRSWGAGADGNAPYTKQDAKSYNIPLQNSNGQSLYGINISISASNESACNANASFSLKTKEGTTLYSASVYSSGKTPVTNTTFCDLLVKTFSTSASYLILSMNAYAHSGSGISSNSGLHQSGYANVSTAVTRYK